MDRSLGGAIAAPVAGSAAAVVAFRSAPDAVGPLALVTVGAVVAFVVGYGLGDRRYLPVATLGLYLLVGGASLWGPVARHGSLDYALAGVGAVGLLIFLFRVWFGNLKRAAARPVDPSVFRRFLSWAGKRFIRVRSGIRRIAAVSPRGVPVGRSLLVAVWFGVAAGAYYLTDVVATSPTVAQSTPVAAERLSVLPAALYLVSLVVPFYRATDWYGLDGIPREEAEAEEGILATIGAFGERLFAVGGDEQPAASASARHRQQRPGPEDPDGGIVDELRDTVDSVRNPDDRGPSPEKIIETAPNSGEGPSTVEGVPDTATAGDETDESVPVPRTEAVTDDSGESDHPGESEGSVPNEPASDDPASDPVVAPAPDAATDEGDETDTDPVVAPAADPMPDDPDDEAQADSQPVVAPATDSPPSDDTADEDDDQSDDDSIPIEDPGDVSPIDEDDDALSAAEDDSLSATDADDGTPDVGPTDPDETSEPSRTAVEEAADDPESRGADPPDIDLSSLVEDDAEDGDVADEEASGESSGQGGDEAIDDSQPTTEVGESDGRRDARPDEASIPRGGVDVTTPDTDDCGSADPLQDDPFETPEIRSIDEDSDEVQQDPHEDSDEVQQDPDTGSEATRQDPDGVVQQGSDSADETDLQGPGGADETDERGSDAADERPGATNAEGVTSWTDIDEADDKFDDLGEGDQFDDLGGDDVFEDTSDDGGEDETAGAVGVADRVAEILGTDDDGDEDDEDADADDV